MSPSIFLLFSVLSFVSAQVAVRGPCPDVTVVQDFDVERYLGLWQENERFPMVFEAGDCSTAQYGPVDENGTVAVRNREIVNNAESVIDGTAHLENSNSTEAKLIVTFYVGLNNETTSPYWVLGTDYDNYSLVWTCIPLGADLHFEASWILGRTKPLSADASKAVEDLIVANGINRSHYGKHDTANCTTYP